MFRTEYIHPYFSQHILELPGTLPLLRRGPSGFKNKQANKQEHRREWNLRHLSVYSPVFTNCTITTTFNKTSNICVTQHIAAFAWPLLQWKIKKYYIFWVCVFILSIDIRHTNHIFFFGLIILSSMACVALSCFSMLSHKQYYSR
jgi:hypothetical protein